MPFLFPLTFLLQQSGAEQGLPRKTMVADDLVESFARCHHLPAILLSGSVVTSEWRVVLTHAQAFQEDCCTLVCYTAAFSVVTQRSSEGCVTTLKTAV